MRDMSDLFPNKSLSLEEGNGEVGREGEGRGRVMRPGGSFDEAYVRVSHPPPTPLTAAHTGPTPTPLLPPIPSTTITHLATPTTTQNTLAPPLLHTPTTQATLTPTTQSTLTPPPRHTPSTHPATPITTQDASAPPHHHTPSTHTETPTTTQATLATTAQDAPAPPHHHTLAKHLATHGEEKVGGSAPPPPRVGGQGPGQNTSDTRLAPTPPSGQQHRPRAPPRPPKPLFTPAAPLTSGPATTGSPQTLAGPAKPFAPPSAAGPVGTQEPRPSIHAPQQPPPLPTAISPTYAEGGLQPPLRGPGDQPLVAPQSRASPPIATGPLSVELQALVNSFRQAAGPVPPRPAAQEAPSPPFRQPKLPRFRSPAPSPPPLETRVTSKSSSPAVTVMLSDCTHDGADGAGGRRVEALSSPTWRGSFLLQRDLPAPEDDWGASDESITFVFVTPEEEAAAGTRRHPEASPPPSPSDRYRSSPDLSQAGLSITLPHGARRTHPYDLYRSTGGSLNRVASLDSASRALGRLGAARQRAGLTRTCSLEDASQEVRDILERARRHPSQDSLLEEREGASPPPSPPHSAGQPRPAVPTPALLSSARRPASPPTTTTAAPTAAATTRLFRPPSPSPSPPASPGLSFREASWPDMKSLILGRPQPPAAAAATAARRLAAEGSRSSPQLHRRAVAAAAGLTKKAVSWTDLHGGGDLETELPLEEGARGPQLPPSVGASPRLRSIMKKPSLAPIAPTPPPPTPPTPKRASPPPGPQPPSTAANPTSAEASSDEDSLPLPRSNLRQLFSLRLPQHIRDRVLRGAPAPAPVPAPAHETPATPSPPRGMVTSPPAPTRALRPPLHGGAGWVRPAGSLSTEEGGSSTSLSSAVFPASRAASSSGVSCSGYSSTGAISSPGASSPLRDAATTACRVLNALSPGRPATGHTPCSSVPSTPSTPSTDGVFTAPASPSTTLSAPTTPTLLPRRSGGGGGAAGGDADGAGLGRCHSEGDLAGRGGAGQPWAALSRVVEEAGAVLKTLSETSLALRQHALSPARAAAPLPPLPEEGGSRVVSVAVQTDRRHVRGLWRDATTSCDSLSDGEASEDTTPRRYLQVPRRHHAAPRPALPRGLPEWRARRERLGRSAGWGGGRSSSSEWDSPSPGGGETLDSGSARCLARQQRRLEESCRRLEERLALQAHKRHLRRRILAEHHNHYNTAERCVLHSSLDCGKAPLCGHMGPAPPSPYLAHAHAHASSSSPYLSTPTLPTSSPSPPCCCVSPVHLPHHHLCRSLSSPCPAHASPHAAPCYAAPPEPSYSPARRDARMEASRQQCHQQLAAARRLLGGGGSTSSLGDASPPPLARHPRLTPGGGSLDAYTRRQQQQQRASTALDTPFLRGHAASLSSLPGASGGAWRRGGLGGLGGLGSFSSVASEGEAHDPRRASRWRGDSDPWLPAARLR